MEIGPIKEGKPVVIEQAKQEKPVDAGEIAERQTDNVEISADARRFLAAIDKNEEIATIEESNFEDNAWRDRSRLDQIRERIDSGYYDQDIVRDMTVEKMIDDMLRDINSFYK